MRKMIHRRIRALRSASPLNALLFAKLAAAKRLYGSASGSVM